MGYQRAFARDAVAWGVTSVQNVGTDLAPATLARVTRLAALPIRQRIVRWGITGPDGRRRAEWNGIDEHPSRLAAVSGRKWIVDGTPLERLALMREPYADHPEWRGQLDFPADTLRAMLREALADHEQLMLHVVGDSTIRVVFSLMQSLAPDSVWRAQRRRLEHGDFLTPDLLPTARRLGVIVVQNPAHATTPQVTTRHLGSRASQMFALRSIVEAGVPLAIGGDGLRNPFLNLLFATTNPQNPGEALSREQAVTAYTRGSAFAEGAEREKGTLAPGMLADLAVLSQDIFTVPPDALPATTSVLTMVGGVVVHDAGVLQRR